MHSALLTFTTLYYRTRIKKIFSSHNQAALDLLNSNWYECTGDPRDSELVKRLSIVQKLERFYLEAAEDPNHYSELFASARSGFCIGREIYA